MRKIFLACWVMLVAVLMLPSCLGSDDDVTVYDDVAITSFTLGTLNRYVTKTLSDGSDSTYKVTYAGSAYKVGDIPVVPMGETIKSMTSDSLFTYSSTDSIDFSQPRTFRVFSTDGLYYRDYVVSISARQYAAGSLLWTAMGNTAMPEAEIVPDSIDEQNIADDASLLPRKSLAYVSWTAADNIKYSLWAGLRADTDTAMTLWRKVSDANHAGQWVYMTQAEDNPYYLPAMSQAALVYYGGSLLALGGNGAIYQSRDQGITWKSSSTQKMPEGFGGAPLKAVVSEGYLWLQDGKGRVWRGVMNK